MRGPRTLCEAACATQQSHGKASMRRQVPSPRADAHDTHEYRVTPGACLLRDLRAKGGRRRTRPAAVGDASRCAQLRHSSNGCLRNGLAQLPQQLIAGRTNNLIVLAHASSEGAQHRLQAHGAQGTDQRALAASHAPRQREVPDIISASELVECALACRRLVHGEQLLPKQRDHQRLRPRHAQLPQDLPVLLVEVRRPLRVWKMAEQAGAPIGACPRCEVQARPRAKNRVPDASCILEQLLRSCGQRALRTPAARACRRVSAERRSRVRGRLGDLPLRVIVQGLPPKKEVAHLCVDTAGLANARPEATHRDEDLPRPLAGRRGVHNAPQLLQALR
mmetsp:Transcript_126287/g.365565  ORF Transcript_126287/g.365565 Transcript_126287/m.365565 type:complete len:335 (-) Transcript_126287:243-1247(-)